MILRSETQWLSRSIFSSREVFTSISTGSSPTSSGRLRCSSQNSTATTSTTAALETKAARQSPNTWYAHQPAKGVDQAAEGVAGAPVAQHPAALAGGEEAADVLAQPAPAGGLRQALDHHAGGEDRQGGEGAHGQCGERGDQQAAEDDHAGPKRSAKMPQVNWPMA